MEKYTCVGLTKKRDLRRFEQRCQKNQPPELITPPVVTPIPESLELFTSSITLTNWHDELYANSCICLLVHVNSSNLVKIGVNQNYDITPTTTFVPYTDYIATQQEYFDKHPRLEYGNLNNQSIIDNIALNNSALPLYIVKEHWQAARNFMPTALGLMFAHHPRGYHENYDKLPFAILNEAMRELYTTRTNTVQIQTFIALLRTCAEIAFERKWNRGCLRLVENYISNPVWCDQIIGQVIATGAKIDLDKLVNCILAEHERLNAPEQDLIIVAAFCKMYSTLHKLYDMLGSYNKFIKLLEQNQGVLPNEYVEFISSEIIRFKKITPAQIKLLYVEPSL